MFFEKNGKDLSIYLKDIRINFEKYNYLAKYYILKALISLNLYSKLFYDIKDNVKKAKKIISFLEFSEDVSTLTLNEFKKILIQKYEEIKKTELNNLLLNENIDKLSKIINLNEDEKKLLKFAILLTTNSSLNEISVYLEEDLNNITLKIILSKLLDIKFESLNNILDKNSTLCKSNLIEIEKHTFSYSYDLDDMIRTLKGFSENMLFKEGNVFEFLKEYIKPVTMPSLDLNDYVHLQKDINNLINLLSTTNNVNILFYGPPGTGKTELSKLLALKLNKNIYEISYLNKDDEPIENKERLSNYKFAQYILKNRNSILLYDEAENIFNEETQKKHKIWINRSLEETFVPTIWISNDISFADKAVLRRFDYILKIPIPSKKFRKSIIKKYIPNISKKTLKLLSSHKYLSPAVISTSVNIWKKIDLDEKELIRIVNHTLTAQGYHKISKKKKNKNKKIDLPNFYNIKFINSSVNISNLIKGLNSSPRANIFIYGIPGTGKSAFGKYIANVLNKEFIIKKGSDLLSMYVGETEKNIARAFKEAKEKNAVLIFDEVDTFLQDRSLATRNWEISQVNEMLTQMEEFDGIFIATTNLVDNLDKASLRRFDVKMEFKPLKPAQIKYLSLAILKELKIPIKREAINKIIKLENLTFGDFNTIIKQDKINKINSIEDFYNRLLEEIKIKKLDTNTIGFDI